MRDVARGQAQGFDLGQLTVCRLGWDECAEGAESTVDAVGSVPFPSVGCLPLLVVTTQPRALAFAFALGPGARQGMARAALAAATLQLLQIGCSTPARLHGQAGSPSAPSLLCPAAATLLLLASAVAALPTPLQQQGHFLNGCCF